MKNTKFIFSALNGLALVVGCLFWLLSVVAKDVFGWFNLAFAVTIICGVWGISFILQAVVLKESTTVKRSRVIVGAIFLVIAVVSLVWAITMPTDIILPLICLVVSIVIFATTFITGGKKWDEADNEKEGYKTYSERNEIDKD